MQEELYDIVPEEFIIKSREESEDGDYLYTLVPVSRRGNCPLCGSFNIIKHGISARDIRDTSVHGHRVGLHIESSRYLCKSCHGTFNDSFKSITDDAKITNRLRDYIRKESMLRPFLNIAEELGMSDTTVRNIFKEYAKSLDDERILKTPRVLGIDENHICGTYRAVFVDIEAKTLIEMLPDRKKPHVINFIQSLPNYKNIKVVTCDMYTGYREAAYECIPHVAVVIDKFHVIKTVNDALEKTRRSLRKEIGKDESRKLRHSKGLMLKDSDDLSFEQSVALMELFSEYPMFEEPYRLKEGFRNIYKCKTKAEVIQKFKEWESIAKEFTEFIPVIDTVNNWNREIFNYFDYRYTNAVTESLNKLINDIAEKGRGYSFEVLRLKCLYGTKATKKAKYNFKKYKVQKEEPASFRRMSFMTSGYMTFEDKPSYEVVEKKELISGFGVDIEELDGIINSEAF